VVTGNGFGCISIVTLRQSPLVLQLFDTIMYVTSHWGQLSLLPSVELSTGQGALAVLCSWEGNHRSGVTLAMHHRLLFIYLPSHWPEEGRWAPCLHSCKEYGTFHLLPLLYILEETRKNLIHFCVFCAQYMAFVKTMEKLPTRKIYNFYRLM